MRQKILVAVVVSCCAAFVHAQPSQLSGVSAGLGTETVDVLPFGREARRATPSEDGLMQMMGKGGVTVEEVGDPESFGRNMTYLGLAQTTPVIVTEDCSLYAPEDGICIETNPAPTPTSVNEPDLAVIELPGKATKTLLCFTVTPVTTWQWENTTGSTQIARMFLSPSVRIESDVLNDPTLLDPGTGLPFNGVLLDSTLTTFRQLRSLEPGEIDLQAHATTRSCINGLFSERVLRDSYGLPDAVIKDFFKNPITVTFGVRGNVAMVSEASYLVGARLYGD